MSVGEVVQNVGLKDSASAATTKLFDGINIAVGIAARRAFVLCFNAGSDAMEFCSGRYRHNVNLWNPVYTGAEAPTVVRNEIVISRLGRRVSSFAKCSRSTEGFASKVNTRTLIGFPLNQA